MYWILAVVLYVCVSCIITLNTFIFTDHHEANLLPAEFKQSVVVVERVHETIDKHDNTSKQNNTHVMRNHSGRYQDLERLLLKTTLTCSGVFRTDKISYWNQYWQTWQDETSAIFLYSAFYDDRVVIGNLPVVRILAVTLNAPADLFCQIWYDEFDMPFLVKADSVSSGRGDKFPGYIKYDQFLYSCALPTVLPVPSHVSIATGSCTNSSFYLPITASKNSTETKDFGICVAIAFGQIPHSHFVEWMEFHRIFGVDEFNIYNGSISSDMNIVFNPYIEKGILRVFPMPPPINDFSKKGVKLGSPASLNDCMMRNWYRYKYIILLDFDEFIIPRMHSNYTSMLAAIDITKNLTSPWRSYTFRNTYHFDHFPVDASQPEYLKTMRYRTRIEPSRFLYAAKSFIDPRQCLSVFNHYCYRRFSSLKTPNTIDVSTSIAMSHHFRTCEFDLAKCNTLSKQKTVDDIMLKFKAQLKLRVDDLLSQIKAV